MENRAKREIQPDSVALAGHKCGRTWAGPPRVRGRPPSRAPRSSSLVSNLAPFHCTRVSIACPSECAALYFAHADPDGPDSRSLTDSSAAELGETPAARAGAKIQAWIER